MCAGWGDTLWILKKGPQGVWELWGQEEWMEGDALTSEEQKRQFAYY